MPDDVKILSNIAAGGALRIKGLDHVVLRVADIERSIAFYGDVLGCMSSAVWPRSAGAAARRQPR